MEMHISAQRQRVKEEAIHYHTKYPSRESHQQERPERVKARMLTQPVSVPSGSSLTFGAKHAWSLSETILSFFFFSFFNHFFFSDSLNRCCDRRLCLCFRGASFARNYYVYFFFLLFLLFEKLIDGGGFISCSKCVYSSYLDLSITGNLYEMQNLAKSNSRIFSLQKY